MAGLSTGLKKKLSISPCTVEASGSITVDSGTSFDVMLNPSGYTHQHAISYSQRKTFGQLGTDSKFNAVEAEKSISIS